VCVCVDGTVGGNGVLCVRSGLYGTYVGGEVVGELTSPAGSQ
jgi:hypothetical protein